MTSLLFPDAGSRLAIDRAGRPRPAKTAAIYADAAGTVPAEIYADSSGVRGALIASSTLVTDQFGMLPPFWGPDAGTDRLYAEVDGGPVWPVDAAANERIDALAARVVVLEEGGGNEALNAHTAATTNVHGIANTGVLETQAGAQAKAAAAADAAQSAAIAAAATAALQKNQNLADLLDLTAARTSLGLGTAALRNVGTIAGTVAAGDDSRLGNDRNPLPHASRHGAAGDDAITVAQSQVTGLVAALADKADLGEDGKLLSGQMPDITINSTYAVESEAEMLALAASVGDLAIRIDLDPAEAYVLTAPDPEVLANWVQINLAGAVLSVNGETGAVTLTAASVGAVPTARTVTAGTGLTGGGDLTADRSFAVAYGSTAGTAAQGNDSRLSDARTPTAHAATHEAAGPDPITVGQAQVSGLTESLALKADLVGGLIPTAQIPALAINTVATVASEAAMLALSAQRGDMAIRTDFNPDRVYVLATDSPGTLADWVQISFGALASVNGQTGVVVLGAADVGAPPTTRQVIAGTGLTGGGDLSADRTFVVAYGTTSTTATRGDDSRVTGAAQKSANLSDLASAATARTNLGAVPTTRQMAAGTGLTGGGDLSADRTYAVAYGTTAGTAAQGNDSRITGAVQKTNLHVNVMDHGAVGNGTTDDSAAIQAAIDAAGSTRAVYFPSTSAHYFCASGLTGTTFTRLVGESFYLGAGPTSPKIRFATAVAVGFAAGTNNTIERLRIDGGDQAAGNTAVTSPNHLRLTDVALYRWGVGWDATNGYYAQATRLDAQLCTTAIKLTGCYNVNLYGPSFRSCDTAIDVVTTVSPLNVFGGSIESYTSAGGIVIRAAAAGSLVSVWGTYFESPTATNHVAVVCTAAGAGTKTTINIAGCLVYLANGDAFVDLGSTAAALNSRNNQFRCSAGSTTTPAVYKIASATGAVNVHGDDIRFMDKGTYIDGSGVPIVRHRPAATKLITNRYYMTSGPITATGTIMQLQWQYFVPYIVEEPHTFTQLGLNVTTAGAAGATLRFGLYADNNNIPGALIVDTGTVAADTTGFKSATISAMLAPGLYWKSVSSQIAGVQPTVKMRAGWHDGAVGVITPGNFRCGGYLLTGVTGAFASNPTVVDCGDVPAIMIRA